MVEKNQRRYLKDQEKKATKIAKSRGYRISNVVAIVGATPKNVRRKLGDFEIGSKGSNGRMTYDIRESTRPQVHVDVNLGQEAPSTLYCNCPAQARGYNAYGVPCKHQLALLLQFNAMVRNGQDKIPGFTVYNRKAIRNAIKVLGGIKKVREMAKRRAAKEAARKTS